MCLREAEQVAYKILLRIPIKFEDSRVSRPPGRNPEPSVASCACHTRSTADSGPMFADYLRAQADKCDRWSRDCFDLTAATRFRLMAEEFRMKATEIEAAAPKPIEKDNR